MKEITTIINVRMTFTDIFSDSVEENGAKEKEEIEEEIKEMMGADHVELLKRQDFMFDLTEEDLKEKGFAIVDDPEAMMKILSEVQAEDGYAN